MMWDIAHDPVRHRFETTVEGERCRLDYVPEGATMIIAHVVVPESVGRRGIAAALMRAALEHARESGWHVVAQCPYAEYFMREHPEWSDLIAS